MSAERKFPSLSSLLPTISCQAGRRHPHLDCDVLHVIINVLQSAGGEKPSLRHSGSWPAIPRADRGVDGQFRGRACMAPRVPRRLRPLRSTVARLGPGTQAIIANCLCRDAREDR